MGIVVVSYRRTWGKSNFPLNSSLYMKSSTFQRVPIKPWKMWENVELTPFNNHLTPLGRSRMIYVFVCSLVMINWRWMLGSAGARTYFQVDPQVRISFFRLGIARTKQPPTTTTNHWSWHLPNTAWNPLVLYMFFDMNLWTLRNSGLFPSKEVSSRDSRHNFYATKN